MAYSPCLRNANLGPCRQTNAIEVCRAELFTKEVELRERYPGQMVEKVLRVREMYNWFIANPDGTDREFVAEVCPTGH